MSIDEIIIKNCDFHLHLLSNFIILTFVLESGAQNRKSSSFQLPRPSIPPGCPAFMANIYIYTIHNSLLTIRICSIFKIIYI